MPRDRHAQSGHEFGQRLLTIRAGLLKNMRDVRAHCVDGNAELCRGVVQRSTIGDSKRYACFTRCEAGQS